MARIGRPEVIAADTGSAVIDPVTGQPARDVNYITLADTEPLLIDEQPDALDDLGLTEARQKMDAAHNDIIQTKYDLAVWKATPGLFAEDKPAKSPFTEIRERNNSPQPHAVTAEEIQTAIDAASIKDPEYRAAAKEFLAEVLPAVKKENARLIAELNAAEAELAQIVREYKAKANAARRNLEDFNRDILTEYKKFETANSGSHTPENFIITSPACRPLVGYNVGKYEKVILLEEIQKKINALEAAEARDKDPEYIKQLARNNAKNNTVTKEGRRGVFFR